MSMTKQICNIGFIAVHDNRSKYYDTYLRIQDIKVNYETTDIRQPIQIWNWVYKMKSLYKSDTDQYQIMYQCVWDYYSTAQPQNTKQISDWQTHCDLVTPHGDIDKDQHLSDLLSDGTKPLPGPMLTYHQRYSHAFIPGWCLHEVLMKPQVVFEIFII